MSTIEITQRSFLLRYGASLIIYTELLIICMMIILYFVGGAYTSALVILFLSPLLGSVIAGRRLKKYKKVLFTEKINKYFIIINVLLYIGIYVMNFKLNVTFIAIYAIGAVIGFFIAQKSVEKIKANMKE